MKNNIMVFNCARVHIGEYSYGHNSFDPRFDTYHSVKCGYELIEGRITTKTINPIKIRGADDEGKYKYHILKTVVIYPATDEAVIRISGKHGSNLLKLVKHKTGTHSTIYKMKL